MSQLLGFDQPAPATAASDGDGNAGDLIKETSEATFMEDVIEVSKTTPVIVDFTAPWCGPCKTLIPLLEKHVTAAGGAVKMVKVDIDQNQMLASQLRIQSVPTVYAFFQGQPIDGFQGAQQESEVKEFVNKLTAMGGGGVDAEAVEALMTQAQEALDTDQADQAATIFQEVLMQDGENKAAFAGLIMAVMKLEGPEAAKEIIDSLEDAIAQSPEVVSVAAAIKLAEESAELVAQLQPLKSKLEANPEDHQTAIELAQALAGADQKTEAIDVLIASIKSDRDWNEGAARAKLLELFDAFGQTSGETKDGRRKLSAVLFS